METEVATSCSQVGLLVGVGDINSSIKLPTNDCLKTHLVIEPVPDTVNDALLCLQTGAQHDCLPKGLILQ